MWNRYLRRFAIDPWYRVASQRLHLTLGDFWQRTYRRLTGGFNQNAFRQAMEQFANPPHRV